MANIGIKVDSSGAGVAPAEARTGIPFVNSIGLLTVDPEKLSWDDVNNILKISKLSSNNEAGEISAIGGSVTLQEYKTTFSGDASGNTNATAHRFNLKVQGVNPVSSAQGIQSSVEIDTLQLVTEARAYEGWVETDDLGGTITAARAFEGYLVLNNAAAVITQGVVFRAHAPIFVASGLINTQWGFQCSDIGHATAVNAAAAFKSLDITTCAVSTRGLELSLSAGVGKNNLYIDGTAENFISAPTGIGITPSPSTALALFASTTAKSSLRLPHGTAPSAPVNGDIWTTTAGIFARINGATVGPLT